MLRRARMAAVAAAMVLAPVAAVMATAAQPLATVAVAEDASTTGSEPLPVQPPVTVTLDDTSWG